MHYRIEGELRHVQQEVRDLLVGPASLCPKDLNQQRSLRLPQEIKITRNQTAESRKLQKSGVIAADAMDMDTRLVGHGCAGSVEFAEASIISALVSFEEETALQREGERLLRLFA